MERKLGTFSPISNIVEKYFNQEHRLPEQDKVEKQLPGEYKVKKKTTARGG